MSSEERFCLRWNNHQSHLSSVLENFLADSEFVDVTLACDGIKVSAHRLILSACSPYFRDLLKENNSHRTIIVLRDVSHQHVTAILQFIYHGEVKVKQEELADFLKTAESLRIQGLTEQEENNEINNEDYETKEFREKESKESSQNSDHQKNTQIPKNHQSQKRASLDNELNSFPKHQKLNPAVIPQEQKHVNVKQEDLEIVDLENSDFTTYDGDSNGLTKDAISDMDQQDFWTGSGESPIPQPATFPPPNLAQRSTSFSPPSLAQRSFSPPSLAQRSSVKLRSDLIAPIDPLAKAKARGFQLWSNNSSAASQQPSLQNLVNNKPCVCNMCGRRFCYRNQLTEHKKTAHHMDG